MSLIYTPHNFPTDNSNSRLNIVLFHMFIIYMKRKRDPHVNHSSDLFWVVHSMLITEILSLIQPEITMY